jgi:hypothetical protein
VTGIDLFCTTQREFLEWAAERLPELKTCIHKAMKLPLPQSATEVTVPVADKYLQILAQISPDMSVDDKVYGSGLVDLALTVLYYLWLLSPLSIDDCIYPSCTGLTATISVVR